MNIKTIAKNPTAYHNYIIEDKIETGIVLSGTEIKSIRNGKINLKDTYAQITNVSKTINAQKKYYLFYVLLKKPV